MSADASAQLLFCENETNNERLFGAPNASAYVKDGINDFVVGGAEGAVNPDRTGTKLAAHHVLEIAPGASASIRLRLSAAGDGAAAATGAALGERFDRVVEARRDEADRFYETVVPATLDDDERECHASGAGRAAVGKAVLRVRRPPLAARARDRSLGSARSGELVAKRAVVPHGRRATSSRCPTSGSTRGLPPGTWRSTRRRCRWSTSTSPSSRSSCWCGPDTCTRTGKSRPTSGTSATSTRR